MFQLDKNVASLWDYSAYFTAVIKVYKNDQKHYIEDMQKVIHDLKWYLSKNRDDDYLVYASEEGEEKPVFYDDNVWLAIGFLELYEITNNKTYLEKAKELLRFIFDSWQEHLGGGLLWREFAETLPKDKWVRNTCINGPAAYASARVYELTKDPYYLNFSEKIYKWTKDNLKAKDSFLYYDNINEHGVIEKTTWTYNVGTMISSGALLYNLTGKLEYKNDALNSLIDSFKLLTTSHKDHPEHKYFDDSPWFRVYIFQGMLDAYRYLNEITVEKMFDSVLESFNYLYLNYQDENKFLINNWSKYPKDNAEDQALFASGNLETISLFQEYLKLKKGVNV